MYEISGKSYGSLLQLQTELRYKNPLFYKSLKNEILVRYPDIEFVEDYGGCILEIISSDTIATNSLAVVDDEAMLYDTFGSAEEAHQILGVFSAQFESEALTAKLSVSSNTMPNNPKNCVDGFKEKSLSFWNLHTLTSTMHYSNIVYRGGYRKKENVLCYGNLLIADIDNKVDGKYLQQYKIKEAKTIVSSFANCIVTTKSHTDDWHRYRVILPFDKPLPASWSDKEYSEFTKFSFEYIGFDTSKLDNSCFDTNTQYSPNSNQQHWYHDGNVLSFKLFEDEFIEHYSDKLLQKHISSLAKDSVKSSTYLNQSSDLKEMRSVLRNVTDASIAKSILQEPPFNYSFQSNTIRFDDNKTTAVCINPKTGKLSDFANQKSYDIASVLMDRFNYGYKDAIDFWYTQLINKGVML